MIRATTEVSAFAMELCTCTRCGALLTRYDFGTDDLGRTLEKCPRCGPALLQARRGAPLAHARPLAVLKPCGKCEGCGKGLRFRTGGKPVRCRDCQTKHRRVTQLARYYTLHGKRA